MLRWTLVAAVILLISLHEEDRRVFSAEGTDPPCQHWQSRHPAWIWCDDFEVDRLRGYFEYDLRNGRFVRETAAGVNGSVGMRAEYLPGDLHGGFLHVAFGKTPAPYIKPVDAGTTRHTDIYGGSRCAINGAGSEAAETN